MTKSQKQLLDEVLEQMDFWMEHQTNLILLVWADLLPLSLRGRIVGRLKRLFLFDVHGGEIRVPLIPENYERLLHNQQTPEVMLESAGETLRLAEDPREWTNGDQRTVISLTALPV